MMRAKGEMSGVGSVEPTDIKVRWKMWLMCGLQKEAFITELLVSFNLSILPGNAVCTDICL